MTFKTEEKLKPHEKALNDLLILATRQGRSGELDEGGVSLIYHSIAQLNKEWSIKYKNKIAQQIAKELEKANN